MGRTRTTHLLAAALLAVSLTGCAKPPTQPSAGWRTPTNGPAAPLGPADPSASPSPGTAPTRSFAVGIREFEVNRGGDRPLPVTIWYPGSGSTGAAPKRAAPVATGRFPMVLFSHGLGARPDDYEPLLRRWAAAGFVVVAPAYPHTSRGVANYQILDVINQPADASHVLTEVLALDTRADDPLQGHLATDRVGAAGHSAGGITTLGLFTAGRDTRLDAGIVLAGSALGVGTAFSGPAAPQLFVHGQLDNVVSHQAGKAAYNQVPWPKAMLSLPNGDHGQSLLRDGDRAFTVVVETTVEFLRWSLYGDPGAKRRLALAAVRGGLAELDDQL